MNPQLLHRINIRWAPLRGATRQRQLLRKLAHDLRSPLSSILLMAQLLEEAGATPDTIRLAGRIQKQCTVLENLLNEAMDKV